MLLLRSECCRFTCEIFGAFCVSVVRLSNSDCVACAFSAFGKLELPGLCFRCVSRANVACSQLLFCLLKNPCLKSKFGALSQLLFLSLCLWCVPFFSVARLVPVVLGRNKSFISRVGVAFLELLYGSLYYAFDSRLFFLTVSVFRKIRISEFFFKNYHMNARKIPCEIRCLLLCKRTADLRGLAVSRRFQKNDNLPENFFLTRWWQSSQASFY